MRLFVAGSGGQLGQELTRRAPGHGLDIRGLDLPHLDVTDADNVARAVARAEPDVVINASAYTAVDRAESEPDAAFAVNTHGPENLALACDRAGIPLVHVSTDYVFDGTKRGAYKEADPVAPLGVYGRSKADGETRVRATTPRHVIVRTAWLYGVDGHNFVKTMLRLGRERATLSVVDDQHGCPTYAADLAEALLTAAKRLTDNPAWGTYHYTNAGQTTWHGFAVKIFELASAYEPLTVQTVKAIPTSEYPTPAARPANSVLDCTQFVGAFGANQPPWDEALARMLRALWGA